MIRFVIFTFLFTVLLYPMSSAGELPRPIFENSAEEVSQSGYIKLSWQWDRPQRDSEIFEFELQQSLNDNFGEAKVIYKGPDYATFLSGLENGDYYYRIRVFSTGNQMRSDWSDPLLVRVKHHSLQLAFTLFGLGAIVFFITVGIVIRGSRATNQNL